MDDVQPHQLGAMVRYVRSQMHYLHSLPADQILNADIQLRVRQ